MKVAVSALYFFSLLASYYVLRPLRDELAVRSGTDRLPWLFSATFLTMLVIVPLFGWAASRIESRRLVPLIYLLFCLSLIAFHFALRDPRSMALGSAFFFVWVGVFNLCIVSLFWSVMAELFDAASAKRQFGPIAAGGSAGALGGPALAALLAPRIGPVNLLLVSAALLAIALVCIQWLLRRERAVLREITPREPTFDNMRHALRSTLMLSLAAIVVCYTMISTFLYFQQTAIATAAIADSGQRTAWFARIDLISNAAAIVLQLAGTSPLVRNLGIGRALAVVPLIVGIGLAALAFAPSLALVAAVQVVHRAGNFAITRPAREMLFTNIGRDAKYKARLFVDTAVFRASDAFAAWAVAALAAIGLGTATVAVAAVPIAAIWAGIALAIGRRHDDDTHHHSSKLAA